MRQFDNKNTYFDLEGKILNGRAKFYKLHTTVLENIYNFQGTPIDNPVFTNTAGQLNWQVFLEDNKDYTIIFEKYIGNGDMSEDQDNWSAQYSCDNLYNVFGIEVDSTTFQLVNNINDLRLLNPNTVTTRDNRKVIILGGYNTIGDKPQVMYIWNPTSIENENGGSVIKVNSIATGRWELVNNFSTEGIDVRHFGVFGTDSRTEATDTMSLHIGVASNYATSVGLPLYFPNINGLTWYKMNNLNIAGAKFAADTRVFGNSGTSTIITVYDENQYLSVFSNNDFDATFTIRGPVVKTSWGVNSNKVVFDPSYRLIIDSDLFTRNRTFQNIVIDCQDNILQEVWLDNCIINSVGKLGGDSTFINCKLTESMFASTTDLSTIVVYDSDTIDLSDWPTTSKWLVLRMQNSFGPLDFEGRTLDSSCIVSWSGNDTLEYRNATLDNFTIQQSNFKLYNCSGTANVTSAPNNITLDECNIVFNTTYSTITGTFYCNKCNVTFGKNMTFGNFYSDYSTINDLSYSYSVSELIVDYSFLNVGFSTNGHVDVQNTTINKKIITGTNNFLFKNDIFNAQHEIPITVADSIISGTWIKNIGNVANPIYFNISGLGTLAADESYHIYQYIDNLGTFVPTEAKSVIYKDGSNIQNTHSGSYELVDYGKIQFYIKNNKDIIIAQPYVESKDLNLFHIGSIVNYKLTMEFIVNYSTFSGSTLPMSFVQIKEYTGNIPNDNWINGYVYMPIIGRLDNNDPTVVNCKIYLKVEKL